MKIFAYYLEDLDLNTGTPIKARNVIKFLARKNEIILAAPNLTSQEILSRIEFYPLKKYSYPKGLNFFFKTRDLKKIIKQVQPDVLYGFDSNSIFALGIIGRQLKIPVVAEMHGVGHSGFDPSIFWRYVLGFFEKMILKHISGVMVVNSKIKDYYSNLAKSPALPVEVIYDGVDVGLFNPEVPMSAEMQEIRKKGKIVIGYVGNFKAYQGIDFILESALETCEDFIYILIGKDSDRLREKIAQYHLQDKVFILGRKKYEEIPGYLKGMDITVIPMPPSFIAEHAIPSKLGNYMAMGKAVVVTDVGGMREMIRDKENGILIPPCDIPKNLIKSFILLKSNPELKKKIERNALDFVRNNLTWEGQAEKINDFLKEVYDKYHRK